MSDFIDAVDGTDAGLSGHQLRHPFVSCLGQEDLLERREDLPALLTVRLLVRDEVFTVQRAAEVLVEPRLDGADGAVLAVFRLKDVVPRVQSRGERLASVRDGG